MICGRVVVPTPGLGQVTTAILFATHTAVSDLLLDSQGLLHQDPCHDDIRSSTAS